jgi:hypothetical protein
VADIGSNTGSVSDIVESEVGDERIEFHEKREWLTDSSGSTEDGDLAFGDGLRGVATAEDVGRWGSG